jgi:TolB-like protein
MNLVRNLPWIIALCLPMGLVPVGSILQANETQAAAEQSPEFYPLALLPFQERGRETKELGGKVTDLLFAKLVVSPALYLVDREDLDKVMEEQELSASGLVKPGAANELGQLTGAKLLVTGSVLQVGNKIVLVCKIIGTETSRVVGASATGSANDDLTEIVDRLGDAVEKAIVERSGDLVPKVVTREDQVKQLAKQLGDAPRPTVSIQVSERHIGQATIDPAAETELTLLCKQLGFEVLDPKRAAQPADITISGEGFSEFAVRRGNLASVKARLEIKAVDRATGKVLVADRQTSVAVDLTEQIAGKSALQRAASEIANRLLPQLVQK